MAHYRTHGRKTAEANAALEARMNISLANPAFMRTEMTGQGSQVTNRAEPTLGGGPR